MARELLLALLLSSGCAGRARDPVGGARRVLEETAAAIEHKDLPAVDLHLVGASVPGDRGARLRDPEAAAAVATLRSLARGTASTWATVRLVGPVRTSITLEREAGGWRVDPESLDQSVASPAAAIEGLIAALERLPSDPALYLLSGALRESILSSSRERTQGLREVLPKLPGLTGSGLSVQVDYGRGLYVVLRLEHGGWRVDDFN